MTLPKAVPALPPRNLNASDVQASAECGVMYKFVCLTRRAEVGSALCVRAGQSWGAVIDYTCAARRRWGSLLG